MAIAHRDTRDVRQLARLADKQWHALMRSLIEDVNVSGNEIAENLHLQEVGGRDEGDRGHCDGVSQRQGCRTQGLLARRRTNTGPKKVN